MRRATWLLIAALLAGCPGKAPTTPVHPAATTSPLVATAAPSPLAGTGSTGAGIVGNNGSGVINGTGSGVVSGNLTGLVRLPASLISDSGGAIISNNGAAVINGTGSGLIGNNGAGVINGTGSGIIGNNSAGYRLAAVSQLPLVGATVALAYADGTPVMGKDGKPLVTQTNAEGRYGFDTTLDQHNLVVSIVLPAKLGTLAAVAPRAADASKVDVDAVSTLTTTYILDRYVDSQAIDKQTTLDKLPADVEADTRTKAGAALDKGAVPLPDALTTDKVVAAVESLRKGDSTLDQQLETVRKLLVVAGQSNLGDGKVATDVVFTRLRDVAIAPDGTVLLADAHRLWRLGTDGKVYTVAGLGDSLQIFGADVDGKPGPQAGLFDLTNIALGPKGDVLMYEPWDDDHGAYILQLGADGIMHTLTSGFKAESVVGFTFDAQGAPLVLNGGNAIARLDAQALQPAITASALHDIVAAGRGADGTIYLQEGPAVHQLDPLTGATKQVFVGPGTADTLLLDHAGNLFYLDGGKLWVRPASGDAPKMLLDKLPDGATGKTAVGALAPGGEAYVTFDLRRLYKVANNQATLVAGGGKLPGGATSGPATELAISAVTALCPLPGGGIVVGNGHQLYKIKDGTATLLAGKDPGGTSGGDGGTALDASFTGPRMVRAAPNGDLYVVDNAYDSLPNPPVRVIGADGKIKTLFTPAGIVDMAIEGDGTVYWTQGSDTSTTDSLMRRKPDGTVDTLIAAAGQRPSLAWTRDGGLAVWPQGAGTGLLWRHDGSTRRFSLYHSEGELPSARRSGEGPACLAVDQAGRFYFTDQQLNTLTRWDPATDRYDVLVGMGGKFFNGTGVDGTLDQPAFPAIDAEGNLYIADLGHNQVKRISAADLQ